MGKLRTRRIAVVIVLAIGIAAAIMADPDVWRVETGESAQTESGQAPKREVAGEKTALTVLEQLPVKGRAPKTNYMRSQFGNGWSNQRGCDTRNIILARDMTDITVNEKCQVVKGVLHDPYTAAVINFERGPESSQAVQIDHVVALSNAWQTGAQQLPELTRIELANDPLNLLAVEGKANQNKADGDAATWLPPNKPFRCQYVARQIAVKQKYNLWVVPAEKEAMTRVLSACPSQLLPIATQN